MAQSYYPLPDSPILTAAQWKKIAQNWLSTGVIKSQLNELLTYADSTGMQVKIKSGQAFIQGSFFESDAEETLSINAADTANPRIDRVIVRIDWTANNIQLAVLQGTAAISPVAPALTQNDSRWEISLSQVYVGANVSTIEVGNVTDERKYAIRPQDFGLGDALSPLSNGFDLNNLDVTGFYSGLALTNAPDTTSFFLIQHFKNSYNVKAQMAFRASDDLIYFRKNNAGTWGAWVQIITSNRSFISVTSNASQSFNSGVDTKVTVLKNEAADNQNEFDTTIVKFTAKEDGEYDIRAFLDWQGSVPTVASYAVIYKNGASIKTIAHATALQYCYGSRILKLNKGDIIELYVNQNSSGTAKTLSFAELQIKKIG